MELIIIQIVQNEKLHPCSLSLANQITNLFSRPLTYKSPSSGRILGSDIFMDPELTLFSALSTDEPHK